jgi:hypothetical protein
MMKTYNATHPHARIVTGNTAIEERGMSSVDLLIEEWGLAEGSRLRSSARQVLEELAAESQLFLRKNPKLQVIDATRTAVPV